MSQAAKRKAVLTPVLALFAAVPVHGPLAAGQDSAPREPPYSCRELYSEQKKCAFGSCDKRVIERLTKEACATAGGRTGLKPGIGSEAAAGGDVEHVHMARSRGWAMRRFNAARNVVLRLAHGARHDRGECPDFCVRRAHQSSF